jgi:hemerythrin-like domain-containing protein
MPKMLDEHKAIVGALDALARAAKEENKIQTVAFTEKLKAHAQTEEQVMYPAAILVGEYLKLKGKLQGGR